jgi:hypothetical protein
MSRVRASGLARRGGPQDAAPDPATRGDPIVDSDRWEDYERGDDPPAVGVVPPLGHEFRLVFPSSSPACGNPDATRMPEPTTPDHEPGFLAQGASRTHTGGAWTWSMNCT